MPTQQTEPPAALPVALDDLKKHLRITSDAEDDLLAGYLAAAVDEIDGTGLLGAAMVSATYTLTTGPARGGDVDLDIGPAQSLEAVEVVRPDGVVEALDVADFALISDGERAFVRGTWGALASRPDAIRVSYVAGTGNASDVPPSLRHAVTLLAAHRYEVRDEVVIGAPVARVPLGVDSLIALHRRRFFG